MGAGRAASPFGAGPEAAGGAAGDPPDSRGREAADRRPFPRVNKSGPVHAVPRAILPRRPRSRGRAARHVARLLPLSRPDIHIRTTGRSSPAWRSWWKSWSGRAAASSSSQYVSRASCLPNDLTTTGAVILALRIILLIYALVRYGWSIPRVAGSRSYWDITRTGVHDVLAAGRDRPGSRGDGARSARAVVIGSSER
jgi:hypothetical protein